MTGCVRLGLAGLLLTALSGCAFDAMTYTIARYGTAPSVQVKLLCRDTYEVLDRPDAGTLLVGTNPLSEVMVLCLEGGPDATTRQRDVARIYLTEKSGRPLCRVVSERDITITHREFSYRCPDDPKWTPRLLPKR